MTVTSNEHKPLLDNAIHMRAPPVSRNDRILPLQLGPLEIKQASRRGILAGIWLAQFLSALNLTLVPTMIPSISSEFQKSNQSSWLGTSYLLATCTFTPLYGRLSDAMGRRGANQSAVLFATVGILACGVSGSMRMLVVARFISGMGGGGIFTTSAIITSDMYTMRSRGFIQSIGGIFYGLGMGLGGPIGGVITDWLGWRWAFLIQVPMFVVSFALTTYYLGYATPGTGRSTKDILKRIDYGGSLALLVAVGSLLFFLSMRYNENQPYSSPTVYCPLLLFIVSLPLFLVVELHLAVEPVLPLALLTHRIPVLVGCSNALVAVCNLSVTYYFPVWWQTVMLKGASEAGLHLLPNSVCISTGSVFAGYMMRKTGSYKTLNVVFGLLPFLGAILLVRMKEDSGAAHLWLSIMPLGFGNAVVLQTMFVALVANLPESQMAVGTGFAQLLRGLGQVGGLAAASTVFQLKLDSELRKRIHTPNVEDLIKQIRHSARLVTDLPPDLQRAARDSYSTSLQAVFTLAACASLIAYLIRLPIPGKDLCDHARPVLDTPPSRDDVESTSSPPSSSEAHSEGEGGDKPRSLRKASCLV